MALIHKKTQKTNEDGTVECCEVTAFKFQGADQQGNFNQSYPQGSSSPHNALVPQQMNAVMPSPMFSHQAGCNCGSRPMMPVGMVGQPNMMGMYPNMIGPGPGMMVTGPNMMGMGPTVPTMIGVMPQNGFQMVPSVVPGGQIGMMQCQNPMGPYNCYKF